LHIPYEGLLDIPEGRVGDFSVKHMHHDAGSLLQTTSTRTLFYGGHDGHTVSYDHPTRWHELLEGKGRWTSDLPIEQFQQRASIVGFRGRVLVGGLGLGVVVRMLAANKNVTRIDVVEKSPEVIKLVGDHVAQDDPRIGIHEGDLAQFLWDTGKGAQWRAQKQPYWHYAFFDIWTGDNEHTFYNTVLPLRRMATPLVKYRITAWNEDIMRGQVQQSLISPLQMMKAGLGHLYTGKDALTLAMLAEETDDEWHQRKQPFYQALLRVNADIEQGYEAARYLAWKWAKTYDGSPEFGRDWIDRAEDNWDFAKMMAASLSKEIG
jgi:hypothetical protein